jgi:hypothetical protein
MSTQVLAPYPVRVDATLEAPSRWLWALKWVLVIPHFVVLVFLWIAYAVMTAVAFFGILFTGRYPRSVFDFNVGVLRWTWRVHYYAYGALGTDRYPPFTLDDVPDYPAHLEIAYPEHLSRGLVLVKWWLLAIPHYLIVAFFLGGTWFAYEAHMGGLIGILVLVAASILAVRGTYPSNLYDVIVGLDRWVLRVAAYAGLMTDDYPPFRLDLGGHEPGGTITMPPPVAPPPPPPATRWSTGRIVAMILGAFLVVISFAPLGAGAVGSILDRTQRDADGYVHTGMHTFATASYALTSRGAVVEFDQQSLRIVRGFLGEARIRVRPAGGKPIFVGIASQHATDLYLRDVEHAVVSDVGRSTGFVTVAGGPPSDTPQAETFWTASTSGSTTRTLSVPIRAGTWSLVVMNADGSRTVRAALDFGATAPNLGWISMAALVVGLIFLAAGVALMVGSATRRS